MYMDAYVAWFVPLMARLGTFLVQTLHQTACCSPGVWRGALDDVYGSPWWLVAQVLENGVPVKTTSNSFHGGD